MQAIILTMTWSQLSSSIPAQHRSDLTIEDRLDQLGHELRALRELLEEERALSMSHLGPVIPLEVAAKELFDKSPDVVIRWVKKGLLTAIALPDGDRGHYYYFNLELLLEELEDNFRYE